MALPSLFRIPKPRSLFHFISLRTAAEFITFTLLVNRVTGLYGILALFTGYSLNWLQLSSYIYSLVILVLAATLAPAVRAPRDPLRIVALAWLYVLDTVINSVYTILFGLGWFVLLTQHLSEETAISSGDNALGKGTMADTAGFTDPELPNAASVEVFATPAKGAIAAQDAIAFATTSPSGTASKASLAVVALQPDSLTSITLLLIFGVCRIYFCLVMLSYARSLLRGYVASTSAAPNSPAYATTADSHLAENPFRAGRDEASRLGRVMTALPTRSYWLGRDDAGAGTGGEWERLTSRMFDAAAATASSKRDLRVTIPRLSYDAAATPGGVGERERRARSGTGPPPPEVAAAAMLGLSDDEKHA